MVYWKRQMLEAKLTDGQTDGQTDWRTDIWMERTIRLNENSTHTIERIKEKDISICCVLDKCWTIGHESFMIDERFFFFSFSQSRDLPLLYITWSVKRPSMILMLLVWVWAFESGSLNVTTTSCKRWNEVKSRLLGFFFWGGGHHKGDICNKI